MCIIEHYYAVQENAWMDSNVWAKYVTKLLKYEIDEPSVILLDNLECHVSEQSENIVAEELNSAVYPLPPNSTSKCQPLDVGDMGPLKSKLRSLWLREEIEMHTANEKRKGMILRTIAAWDSMKTETIAGSFRKAIPKDGVVVNV